MSDQRHHTSSAHDALIARLARDLAPAPPLPHPIVRAATWLAVAVVVAVVFALFSNVAETIRRLLGAPDMWIAFVGSVMTAVLAAFAAFEVSLPDRRSAFALLPIPGLIVWITASGVGCLRGWVLPETHIAPFEETLHCLRFIVGFSLPLSGVMLYMLRRSHPLRPNLVGALAGLAVAALTNVLLDLFHPFDAAATDILIHFLAVLVVIGLNVLGAQKAFGVLTRETDDASR